ncbi:Crp/Fnr family transcriptional regulator [Actinocorallia sp. B10E7]|uniref:Crp/Fnr family transcriptional regulator n=1 Tax=Actinocorallia sp. B10E7 TaxID=3153558 RepID=UPI00325E3408
MDSLTAAERAAFLAAGTRMQYEHESTLILQGNMDREVYLLVDGFVRVTATSDTGNTALLAFRAKGDLVGEFSVLDEKPRSATVEAVGALVAVRISEVRFWRLLNEAPGIHHKITKSVLLKMRMATGHRVASRALDARGRLARVLYELSRRHGVPKKEGIEITLPITQFELGALASVSESTTERILKDFRESGLIRTHYRRVLILKTEELKRSAQSIE